MFEKSRCFHQSRVKGKILKTANTSIKQRLALRASVANFMLHLQEISDSFILQEQFFVLIDFKLCISMWILCFRFFCEFSGNTEEKK